MTKIKNTKKGMAKKTLSISLAVAMLATSNVPVWAAEFTDGTDAAFTSEAVVETPVEEAPVVEEEAPVVGSVVEAGDLSIDVKVSESATFEKDAVKVSGTIKNKKTGESLKDFNYAWRVAGDNVAIYSRTIADGDDITSMGFSPKFKGDGVSVEWDKYAGKTLELYIFKNTDDTDNTKVNPTVIGTTKINKKDISNAELTLVKTREDYNGKSFYIPENNKQDTDANAIWVDSLTLGVGESDNLNLDYFTITASGTAKNAGDVMTVTATAKSDSPYVGTSKDVTFTVGKKSYALGDFEVSVKEGQTFQYTGAPVSVSGATVKEAEKFSGADLSNAITGAVSKDKTIGKHNVIVSLDTEKITNFYRVPGTIETTGSDASANIEITKRDLKNNVKVSIKHGRVQKGTRITDFIDNDLKLTGTEGTPLNLVGGIEGIADADETDYLVTVINPEKETETRGFDLVGTYKVTIQAVDKRGTCVNGQTFEVEVAGNVIAGTEISNTYTPYYTGEAITPSQDDFGQLTIIGKDGDREPLQHNQWKITGYKNNVNAGTAYATVEILGESSYKGQTVDVPFTIKPLEISNSTVKVPETITYNHGYGAASDYKVPVVVTAKDPSGKIVKGLSESDFAVSYKYVDGDDKESNTDAKNEIHDRIQATIVSKNSNFITNVNEANTDGSLDIEKTTEIVAKALADSMIKLTPDTYTYTGGNIMPEFVVNDGVLTLWEGKEGDKVSEYEVVKVVNNLNVGTGTVTIKGINDNYSGTASADFKITPASTADVKVEIEPQKYTGRAVRPRKFTATLNGNVVTNQFEIVGYGENIKAGTGTVVLKPVDTCKNFVGENITAEFKIYNEVVTGNIDVYDANGIKVTEESASNVFEFDGEAKTFATERLVNLQQVKEDGAKIETKAKASDFEIKYAENVTGVPSKNNGNNTAYVYAVAKEGTGYTGNDEITLADGTVIKDVVAKWAFEIKNVHFVKENVSIKNAVYAGGLPVKPEVLIQIKGRTLVEGKDYKVELTGAEAGENYTNVTDGKVYGVKIYGLGGYTGTKLETEFVNRSWGIDKKDLADCDVKVVNGVAYVMNGYIPVPTTEYTVKENDDKTYTVTANKDSKNYTGSKTVVAEGQKPTDKPETPMIQSVKVVGNKATVILSGETEGAVGYDYVISTDKDCINNKDYDKVNKNILNTTTDFTYVGQDVYYAYCHAWKRGEDGKKIFSDWSNAYPFVVSAITPSQPAITSVKVKGSTVTVTYTKSSNADGYDVVLGSKVATVAGEKRPVEYGTLVKKNIKGNTVTATFKNVKKGTYYAGLHAFNRTSEDGKKVFSPWSNVKRVTVK